MEVSMRQGDTASLFVKKYLRKEYEKEYGTCSVSVLRYDEKEASIYFILENEELTNVSLDIIYGCEIYSKEEKMSCTGRVKERYYSEQGKILKFEIENGFYKINLNSVDK